MNPLNVFKKVKAIISKTHVVYASGKHGDAYVNKDAIYPHTKEISRLCKMLAEKFKGLGIQAVAAPTVGGVVLSQWTAHFLCKFDKSDVLAVFAEEEILPNGEKKRIFKRGYNKLISGKKVLVVEDILTTGGSARKVVDAVRALGSEVIGCGALVNRGLVKDEDVGTKITALIDVTLNAWEETSCPLCKKGVPVNTDVGKGREYLCRIKS